MANNKARAAGVSFTDDFSSGASPLWSNYAGNWKATSGKYAAQTPQNLPPTLSSLPYDLTDYTLSVHVNSLGDGGIWARTDGTNKNGLILVTGGNGYGQGDRGPNAGRSLYFQPIVGGKYGSSIAVANNVFTPGNDYTLTLTVVGNTYSAYVNGASTPTLVATSSTFQDGFVGLYDAQPVAPTGSGAPESFSNFSLQGTAAPAPLPAGVWGGLIALLVAAGWSRFATQRARA